MQKPLIVGHQTDYFQAIGLLSLLIIVKLACFITLFGHLPVIKSFNF